jgi:subtilisin-like proprotein convertase family protein
VLTPGHGFTLTVPTTVDTAWGEYDFTVTATSGEIVKEKMVHLSLNPQGLNDFSYSNDTAVDIPDNAPDGVTSVITVGDDITIFDSNTYVNISHTWIGDLIVTLTSPSGTSAILHNKAGGSDDNIDQTFNSSVFNGESTLGDWLLTVVDTAAADTGNLNNWSLTFSGLGDVSPAAPVAGFEYVADNLSVSFTDSSSDVNGDIESWSWNFGDGAISGDQNPVHVFANSGSYDVTLTVTDAEGQSSSKMMTVDVSDVEIELQLKRAYKSRLGYLRVDVTWQGTSSETVDVFRNGVKIDTVSNRGIYRDRERRASGNQFVYQICEPSGAACSNEITANF